jgi:DNA polymerase elongation subunit (family B)
MRFYTSAHLYSNQVLERGFENGKRFDDRINYEPTLHIPTKHDSEFKTLDGTNVQPIKPGTIKDCREFISRYKNTSNFDVYGNTIYQYSYLADVYPTNPTPYDFSLIQIACIDIETGSENGFPDPVTASEEVTAITVGINGKYYVWGCRDFKTDDPNITYYHCNDEVHLLKHFLNEWHFLGPDIVTGWNIQFFDIPYLVNRIRRIIGNNECKLLSPWKIINERLVQSMKFQGGRDVVFYDLVGCATLDYYELYKKYTYTNQESYRLDYIAFVELGDRKLSFEEYGGLQELYQENFQLFIEYNIKDVQLVERLEDKMKLLEMAVALAYDAKVNFVDVFTQVRMWDVLIFNYLKMKNVVVPPKSVAVKDDTYVGAYVKDPIKGMHKWLVSFDLNSLYPHLIMQYNISPETLLPQHLSSSVDRFLDGSVNTSALPKNTCVSASGQLYKTDVRGFLPDMMEERYNNRVVYKKRMLDAQRQLEKETDQQKRINLEKKISQNHNLQLAMKISMNSAYGAMGNQYFRYFDTRLAESITLGGQLAIRWVEKDINKHLNRVLGTQDCDYIIASDTDSLYITLASLVDKIFPDKTKTTNVNIINFLDKVCEQDLQPIIDKSYEGLKEYMHAPTQRMFMKREALADKGIWTGKKHYLLNVYDNEGVRYSEPRLKVMGIESVKSSTPTICRSKLKEAFLVIMNEDESAIQQFIVDFKREFKRAPIEDISFPRSVRNLFKYSDNASIYTKGTPIHVKGSLLHNHLIKKHKLSRSYPLIQEGEKIKFVYLTSPNPVHDHVIAMMTGLPTEFNLHEYIDYEKQFEKSFKKPLAEILKAIGWSPEHVNTLDAFFS